MKKIKIGVAIACFIGCLYCIVSYSIFLYKKASIDEQIEQNMLNMNRMPDEQFILPGQPVVAEIDDLQAGQQQAPVNQLPHPIADNQSVVIQKVCTGSCSKHQDISDPMEQNVASDFFVMSDELDIPAAHMIADDEQDFIVRADDVQQDESSFRSANKQKSHSYSFITMKISDDYRIDQETQDTLDILIGSDVDAFVKLILQSNNNIVSKEACRSCGMYAFFNGIKNHKPLTSDDIRMLQKMLANLYRFVGKMRKLNKNVDIMNSEQYEALQNLHKSEAVKNDMKLQARKSATAAALKKLQTIKYNK